ncbi:MAG: hypothetical protein WA160_16080 [Pseudobdellovibrio sp.]
MKKARRLFKGILLSFLSLGALSSCADKLYDDKKQSDPVSTATIEKVNSLTEDQIKIDYVPLDSPNKYNVTVTWPSFDGYVRIIDNEKQILNEDTSNEDSFTFENFEGGTQKDYSIETYSKERGLKKDWQLSIKPPRDLVFSGEVYLQENFISAADRVFILDNTTIYSMNFDMTLNFSKLYLGNNSKIAAFPTGLKAAEQTSGRSSGHIKFSGKVAKGKLKVTLNSEEGGNGATGGISCFGGWIRDVCEGGSGGDSGKLGALVIELEDASVFYLESEILRPKGGIVGQKYSGDLNGVCIQHPSNIDSLPNCKVVPRVGTDANGGSICTKFGIGASYACKE